MTTKISKDKKVYTVTTARLDEEAGDIPNFSEYTVVALDAEEAINIVKARFCSEDEQEYVQSVGKVATLDELWK